MLIPLTLALSPRVQRGDRTGNVFSHMSGEWLGTLPQQRMHFVYLALIVAGLFPLFRAWQANSHTSLLHAVCWAWAAWLAWGLALLVADAERIGLEPWRYAALCLTG